MVERDIPGGHDEIKNILMSIRQTEKGVSCISGRPVKKRKGLGGFS